jgi:hypothetical protein
MLILRDSLQVRRIALFYCQLVCSDRYDRSEGRGDEIVLGMVGWRQRTCPGSPIVVKLRGKNVGLARLLVTHEGS